MALSRARKSTMRHHRRGDGGLDGDADRNGQELALSIALLPAGRRYDGAVVPRLDLIRICCKLGIDSEE